ncbi:unnamed protein product [Parascedosporium putredinis]|uniref:Uncharacterized protein n=1 Tax=Parascedosporium putredinis TaxID=1442378 RepID=A0A9P1ME40_9PEZI|nr:unnamed protein product [Parascedosporium putredinis]CAI8003894.1 unnamed protein product [Parascedosporium putredinis]
MSSSYDPNIDKSSSPLTQPSEPLASPQDEPASVPTDVAPAAALDFDVNSTSTIVISTGRVREHPCCHCLPAYFNRAHEHGDQVLALAKGVGELSLEPENAGKKNTALMAIVVELEAALA